MINDTRITLKKRIERLLSCLIITLLIMATLIGVKASAETASGNTGGSRIIVSLGDSYSSGEGIEPFYDEDDPDKAGSQDWLAHRSKKSWSGMLTLKGVEKQMKDNRNSNWFFAASSGAKTYNLNDRQKKDFDFENHSGTDYIDRQLDIFKQLKDKKAEYVTMTMGGNDADFVAVVSEASVAGLFNPGSLNDKLASVWYDFYYGLGDNESIRERLYKAYNDVRDTAGAQAKIIIAGYPTLIKQDGSLLFSKENAQLVNESVRRFNDEIESIVKACKTEGMKICFVSVEKDFDGREAYSKVPFINKVYLSKQKQDLKGGLSAYSMHPNEKGAEAYAKCVQEKISEIEKDGGKAEWPEMARSDERDIVLVLDVSGSMDGEPMNETKKASQKFISTILKEDASIGVVTYDTQSMCVADFSMNEGYLSNAIQNLNSGGGTNIEAGLSRAYSMLQSGNAKKKIIVLMSDGQPNEGKVGDELISYADSIKDDGIYLYTLGFFENAGSGKSSAQTLMEELASDGCHYEVADAENLVYFFGDIADQINGQKYIYVRIACPVDVSVSYDGQTLNSKENKQKLRTDYGSLTFEENDSEAAEEYDSNSESDNDNRIKTLRLKEGADYDITIEGNGRGKMDYTIGFMDDNGEYSDLRKFNNIKITRRTVIDTVAANSKSTVLKVDEDGDGKYDLKYKAGANERGKIVDYTYIVYIVVGSICLIILLFITFAIVKYKKHESMTNGVN